MHSEEQKVLALHVAYHRVAPHIGSEHASHRLLHTVCVPGILWECPILVFVYLIEMRVWVLFPYLALLSLIEFFVIARDIV
jgi:hypothetical protein